MSALKFTAAKLALKPKAAKNHLENNAEDAGFSKPLLQALHLLTRDGQLNQDARRKLKQVAHLLGFIEPLLAQTVATQGDFNLVDHGAGKSYLGFLLYDRFVRSAQMQGGIYGVESRPELVEKSQQNAANFGFDGMQFVAQSVAQSADNAALPSRVDVVTALHACDTATDDAIAFALQKQAQHVVLVPCCQAELARHLRAAKGLQMKRQALSELWRHPLHTRELGSHATNVLRCLQLEAHGYQVRVTELVGWEHSMKNELIIASRHPDVARRKAAQRLTDILTELGVPELSERYFCPANPPTQRDTVAQ